MSIAEGFDGIINELVEKRFEETLSKCVGEMSKKDDCGWTSNDGELYHAINMKVRGVMAEIIDKKEAEIRAKVQELVAKKIEDVSLSIEARVR